MNWIKTYEDLFPVGLCEELISFFESSPAKHKLDAPWQRYHQLGLVTTPLFSSIRENVRSIFERYKADANCGTLNYVRFIEAPTMSRYDLDDEAGQHRFHAHADCWSMETASRQVSLIVYLNDVREGGETVFDNGTVIQPKAGRALIFPSSYVFQHEAKAPKSNQKYVLVSWLHWGGTGHVYSTSDLYA
jgi:hypothetical protein